METEEPEIDWQKKYEALSSSYAREKKARKLAEKLLEDKARDLYFSNAELRQSLENLKQAQSQLVQSEKMASVGLLAAGVAHEINNPIAYVHSNLETLFDYTADIKKLINEISKALAVSGPSHEAITQIKQIYKQLNIEFLLGDLDENIGASLDGAKKVRRIVADLSEFSALNTPELKDVDINELLNKTINIAWNNLKYDIQLVKEYGEVPSVSAKSGRLGQVFLNLILNAVHAMEDSPADRVRKLKIKTSSSNEELFVWISDTGHGIPDGTLSSIFDPFYTTKPLGKGTGLGLHISQNIIHNHHGSLRVVDTSSKGTTFEVRLPFKPVN